MVGVRVALYARVSTEERQELETQLAPLREYLGAQGWEPAGEFVDRASAADLRGRAEWRRLLDLASRRRFEAILVWKLDRAFRSVADAVNTLERLRGWGIGLRSYTEPAMDTTTAMGEMVFGLLAVFAQFERSLIRERVRAGMARARAQGKHVGRPRKATA